MILFRLYDGIADHFPIRRMEWLMAVPAGLLSIGLTIQPDMFEVSPSFAILKTWADESTWAALCFALCCIRLLALTINGTFKRFKWSPAIRAAASLFGAFLWAEVTLGFIVSFLTGEGAFSAIAAWGTLSIAESMNVVQTWGDLKQSLRGDGTHA